MVGERRISHDFKEAVKAGHNLVQYAGRSVTWDARKSNPARGDMWACCPFHEEKTPSFHVSEALQRFNCFGCGEKGDLFDFRQKYEGCTFREAFDYFADGREDLDGDEAERRAEERLERRRQAERERQAEEEGRVAKALAFFDEGEIPPIGGPVRSYLQDVRRLSAAVVQLAISSGALRERCDRHGRVSMVALARDFDGRPRGVQITGLQPGGKGKRVLNAEGAARLSLGVIKGCAVRLLEPYRDELAVAEGTETALAFYARFHIPCWALLGTANFRTFRPPPNVKRLVIARDNGAPGEAAASALFDSLSDQLRVVIAPPPQGVGDWNDALKQMEGAAA